MNTNSDSLYLTLFQRELLERSLQQSLPSSYRQRLEIILLTDRGKSQAEICRTLGCCPATASRWIQLTKSGLAHKYLDCPIGRPKVVTEEFIEFLRELLNYSPKNYGYSFKSWTIGWLRKHIAKEIGIEISESHLKRVMGDLGLSTKTQSKQKKSTSSTNICIVDLHENKDRSDNELTEINLSSIKLDSQIYGSRSSRTASFPTATQHNLRGIAQADRISSLC